MKSMTILLILSIIILSGCVSQEIRFVGKCENWCTPKNKSNSNDKNPPMRVEAETNEVRIQYSCDCGAVLGKTK